MASSFGEDAVNDAVIFGGIALAAWIGWKMLQGSSAGQAASSIAAGYQQAAQDIANPGVATGQQAVQNLENSAASEPGLTGPSGNGVAPAPSTSLWSDFVNEWDSIGS